MTINGGFAATSSASSRTSEGSPAGERSLSVTVIVCVYTELRWPQIVRAVGSVLAQDVPAKQVVVVVDHNEALFGRVAAAFPGATVVANTGPRGLSGARNTGVAHAVGDIVAFLDDDAEAEPDWLARLLLHYRDSQVLAVGGQALPAWDDTRPRWLPPEFDWVVGCSFTGQPSRATPVRNVIGCNMSFRRAILDRIEGFDPALGRVGRIPVGCEETELCIRVRQMQPDGLVLYEPAARVHHRVTRDRATWSYFRRRCFSEGRSKAVVARLVGTDEGLSAEREYVRRALPRGVRRGFRETRRGDHAGLLRSGAIIAGLLVTATGYATAYVARASQAATAAARPRRRQGPPPSRVLEVELSNGVPAVSDRRDPGDSRYGAARVLVRRHGRPLGVVDVELPPGGLAADAHAAAIREWLGPAADEYAHPDEREPPPGGPMVAVAGPDAVPTMRESPPVPAPSVTVVVPTCGRTQTLGRTLDSLAGLDYPDCEILVVDNAPHVPETARLVAERAARQPQVRYTSERRAGVAHARNRGLAEASGEIVAFVDDDVTVDKQWLQALVDAFMDEDVAAVTGQVLAGELETPAQVWLERYGGFGKGCQPRRFTKSGFETIDQGLVRRVQVDTRSLYPYLPGTYGSGANMAFRADSLRQAGGFDPLLGSVGAVRAGEDIDVLMRLVLSGQTLVYEPGAIVWHAHRREIRALRRTLYHYGVGLSAVMVKCLVSDAAGRYEILRRLPRGIAYTLLPRSEKNQRKRGGYPASLTALELFGIALGPAHYAAAAWTARRGRARR